MENKSTFNIQSVTDKFNQVVKNARKEVEEMTLQFSLGKAEAGDQFEKVKKDFSHKLQEWKKMIPNADQANSKSAEMMKQKMESLQVQLALGKAEAKDLFEEQRKKIQHAIAEMEVEIRNNPFLKEYSNDFKSETERFKLKMEILKMQFGLKKFEMSDKFKEAIKNAEVESDKLFTKAAQKWDKTKSKYADFGDEIEMAFDHLKKAVKSL